MNLSENILVIDGVEIPAAWAAENSFKLTKTTAPYLLIVADRKDGFLDLILYHQSGYAAKLVAQRKLAFSVKDCITEKMTAAIIQQVQLRRQFQKGNAQKVVQDYENIFVKSEASRQLFERLKTVLMNEAQLSFVDVHEIIQSIFSSCKLILSVYSSYFRRSMDQNTMIHLFNGVFMEWNLLIRMVNEFLNDQMQWVKNENADIQIVFCGELLSMACLADPDCSNMKQLHFSPSSNHLIYRMTNRMLTSDSRKACKLYIIINAYPYEAAMKQVYAKACSSKLIKSQISKKTIRVFNDTILAFPKNAGIYAGSVHGKLLPVLGGALTTSPDNGSMILTAPFSEEFSELIAEKRVVIEFAEWEEKEGCFAFSTAFTLDGKRYCPSPISYSEEKIVNIIAFPELVIYKLPEYNDLYLYMNQSSYQIHVYQGEKTESRIKLPTGEKTIYLKLFDEKQKFLGQFDFVRRKEEAKDGG